MAIYNPHPYQKKAIQHVIDNPGAFLMLDMGLGKSSITLAAIEYLINSLQVQKVLIIAPKKVASHTWTAEIKKWDLFKTLTVSKIVGTKEQRIAAIKAKADIYTIGRDNVAWLQQYLVGTIKRVPFDMIVCDESSSFKNPSSMRFKALRRMAPHVDRVVCLTGTPAPNSLLSLYSQVFLLDQGKRLGKTYTEYKDRYFKPGARMGHIVFQYEIKPGANKLIAEAISDISLSMKAKDYLDLPERLDIYDEVELESYEKYQEFKKTEVHKMGDGFELTPVSAPAMYNLLLQWCNGAVYRYDAQGNKSYEVVDNSKLEQLEEIVDALDGNPVFVIYQFISDLERIQNKIPKAKQIITDADIDAFNRGEIEVGLSQLKSLAYGINLQEKCHTIVHFGIGWDLELYQQVVARIHRQGQNFVVTNKHLVAKDSVEQVVIGRLAKKDMTQEELLEAVKSHLY